MSVSVVTIAISVTNLLSRVNLDSLYIIFFER